MYRSLKHLVLAGALALSVAFLASPVSPLLAQEATPVVTETAATATPTQPEEVATVVVNQDVSIPYGQWIEDIGDIAAAWLIPALLGGLTWVVTRYVPLPLRGIANMILARQAEQLLQKALAYGVRSTKNAGDGTLEVPVANEVLRNGLNYALANGWPKLLEFLDGPDGILQKLFARLDLPKEASASAMGVPEPRVPQKKLDALTKAVKKAGGSVQTTSWVTAK